MSGKVGLLALGRQSWPVVLFKSSSLSVLLYYNFSNKVVSEVFSVGLNFD